MKILKLKGKSEQAILSEIEKEYGDSALILGTSKEEVTGLAKWFRPSKVVVTIAVKDGEDEKEQDIILQEKDIDSSKEKEVVGKSKEYDVLLELKDQISELQREVLEINTKQIKHDNEDINNTNEWYEYIFSRLVEMGIVESTCKNLLQGMENYGLEEIIENVYSRLETVLEESSNNETPQIVFFIGSTGVGKTTTLAKLTAKYVLEEDKKVVLFTADTYRIAAVEQLKTYADILGVDIEVIYNESELPVYLEKWKDADYILIDTAGRSHKNNEQVEELKLLINQVEQKKVFLVLNVNTSYNDINSIIDTYTEVNSEFDLIITKLDETDAIGNIVNISNCTNHGIIYTTNGQNVPSDINLFNKDRYISDLLGRINHE